MKLGIWALKFPHTLKGIIGLIWQGNQIFSLNLVSLWGIFDLVIYCANDVASEKNRFQLKYLIYKVQISSEWFQVIFIFERCYDLLRYSKYLWVVLTQYIWVAISCQIKQSHRETISNLQVIFLCLWAFFLFCFYRFNDFLNSSYLFLSFLSMIHVIFHLCLFRALQSNLLSSCHYPFCACGRTFSEGSLFPKSVFLVYLL